MCDPAARYARVFFSVTPGMAPSHLRINRWPRGAVRSGWRRPPSRRCPALVLPERQESIEGYLVAPRWRKLVCQGMVGQRGVLGRSAVADLSGRCREEAGIIRHRGVRDRESRRRRGCLRTAMARLYSPRACMPRAGIRHELFTNTVSVCVPPLPSQQKKRPETLTCTLE